MINKNSYWIFFSTVRRFYKNVLQHETYLVHFSMSTINCMENVMLECIYCCWWLMPLSRPRRRTGSRMHWAKEVQLAFNKETQKIDLWLQSFPIILSLSEEDGQGGGGYRLDISLTFTDFLAKNISIPLILCAEQRSVHR